MVSGVDVPPPYESLQTAERSLKLVRAYYEQAGQEASLYAASATRRQMISLLARIADAMLAIAEWEPRDFQLYQRMEDLDAKWLSEEFPDDDIAVVGREAFEHHRAATADLYVMADALRRVQILLNNPRSIDPSRLELPE
jgi:hypothetical protein